MRDKPRTSFDLTRDEMRLLRALAADLGSFVRRGPGAGELGNITDLLRRLTVAYDHDPAATTATLSALFAPDDAPTHPANSSSSPR
jgi:hypothetical protein